MKKLWFLSKWILPITLIPVISFSVYAHPGRTDSSGGHYDRSTGEYNYHHGYPAHQHPDGVCPYNFDDKTSQSSGSSNNKSTQRTVPKRFTSEPSENDGVLSAYQRANEKSQNLEKQVNNLNFQLENAKEEINTVNLQLSQTQQYLGYAIAIFSALGIPTVWFLYHSIIDNKKHTSDLQALQETNKHLQEECSRLKQTDWIDKLNQMEQQKNTLMQSNDELQTQINALQKELKDIKLFYSSLQYEKSKLDHTKQQLEFHIERLQNDLAKTQQVLQRTLTAAKQEAEYSSSLRSQLESLTTDALSFPKEFLYKAGVPNGVTFDSNYLPHYYVKPSVEKHMRVYISPTRKCYHRVFGCSGATIQVHLFTVADKYIPCERCIPYEAQNYKIPNWYYEFLKLLNQYVQDNPQIEATDPSLISAETVKASQ